MKILFLVRHAKSSWKQPGLSDHDRTLNRRGRDDAAHMAAFLAGHYAAPQAIISSTAVRARTTAEILAEELGLVAGELRLEPQLYLADVGSLLAITRTLPDELDSVLLTGHNPGLTDLLDTLTGAGIENLPTCAVARIAFDTAHWAEVRPGRGDLLSLDMPKALPDTD